MIKNPIDPDPLFGPTSYRSDIKTETDIGIFHYETSSRGRIVLNFNGHQFTMNRQRGSTKYWECFKKRVKTINCKSRIVTVGSDVKCINAEHNHPLC